MQQPDRIFRIAAIAWLVAAVARVDLFAFQSGPSGSGVPPASYLVGAILGVGVAALLWRRPTRSSAIVASAIGSYAIVGLAYAPLIGPQTWFVILSATGIVAFVLSVVAFFASRTPSGSGA